MKVNESQIKISPKCRELNIFKIFRIFWKFLNFWDFLGNFGGILWELFVEFVGKLFEYEINYLFVKIFLFSRFCLNGEGRKEGHEFRSLEEREASPSQ